MAEAAIKTMLNNLTPPAATSAPAASCATCHYSAANGTLCRRSPPNPAFPAVSPTDWCGEFKLNATLHAAQRAKILKKLDEIQANREEDMRIKPFNGYKSGAGDYVIFGCRLIKTCNACPEQYDVFDDTTGVQIGYLRLRHGAFRADLRAAGGPTVYSAETKGDGVFEDAERMPELKKAVKALKRALVEDVKNTKRAWAQSRG